jgi:3-phosphoshikimate 1-carboxyvinyltransferase
MSERRARPAQPAGPESIDLAPIARMSGTVRLPGSKSISNRTLLLAALAHGRTEINGLLDADDVDRMVEALRTLGVSVEQVEATRDFVVQGIAGDFPVKCAGLFLGNAGTVFRPLTAALAFADGSYELTGVSRMHERPIGDLVDALRSLGARIDYLGRNGYPPLAVRPARLSGPAAVSIRGEVSSQFVTALLLAFPPARTGVTVDVVGELISRPYVEMTLRLMARFGVEVEREKWRRFIVPAGPGYSSPGTIFVEGDASSASYFLAAGAIAGGPVRIVGVGRGSIQGDSRFGDTLAAMGAVVRTGENWIEAEGNRCLTAIDADFGETPDAAMTAAIVALFARGTSTLRNIGSWRVKETDRIAAMAAELRKLGATVAEGPDWLSVTPPVRFVPATIDTYDDHRMAMCFSLAALAGVPVRINDPGCVRKTFPGYFSEFRRLAG